jgi:hypothetical protein
MSDELLLRPLNPTAFQARRDELLEKIQSLPTFQSNTSEAELWLKDSTTTSAWAFDVRVFLNKDSVLLEISARSPAILLDLNALHQAMRSFCGASIEAPDEPGTPIESPLLAGQAAWNKEKPGFFVAAYRSWLATRWTPAEIAECAFDDAGYPHWRAIEAYFQAILRTDALTTLSHEDQADLIYLIARNWDIGSMTAWLSNQPNLSNLGQLKKGDLLKLARTALRLPGREYWDARSQFAKLLGKLTLTPEVEELLLGFYEAPEEYTKRIALLSLGKLGYPNIRALLERSWEIEEEHHRIGCLALIHDHIRDEALLRKYLDLAAGDARPYIARYVAQLNSSLSTN